MKKENHDVGITRTIYTTNGGHLCLPVPFAADVHVCGPFCFFMKKKTPTHVTCDVACDRDSEKIWRMT